MDILFIHPKCLGQFRNIAMALAKIDNINVYALGDKKLCAETFDNIDLTYYELNDECGKDIHRYNKTMDSAIRRGEATTLALILKKQQGFEPDIIFVHPGWGDAFFLKDIFPTTKIVGYCEYYYHPRGADVGFDEEFPMKFDDIFRLRILNAVPLLALNSCDILISPTAWQKSRFPTEYQNKIQILHEGIDTDVVRPDKNAFFMLPTKKILNYGDEVLTYVSRSLEPYRGYHQFMRALPQILKARPNCEVVIVGAHDVSYGRKLSDGQSYMQIYYDEVYDDIDALRIHFVGRLSYQEYLSVLQISRAHVYLTYPFVLSWSALEALSAGCMLIASDTAPVKEVITDGFNGKLVSFFDAKQIALSAIDALAFPKKYITIRENARASVIENFDFNTVSLKAYIKLIENEGLL